MRKSYLIILLCFFIFSLEASVVKFKTGKNIVNDSLQRKTLQELAIEFWRGKNLDSILKRKIANTYLIKAKKLGNNKLIADGYQMFMYQYKAQFEIYLKYSDSIINITEDLKNSHYPATGYIFKGGVLQNMERYHEALKALLKAKEIAEINGFDMQVILVEDKIAELKNILGKDLEAFEIYKKHFSILSQKDEIKKMDQVFIGVVSKLADSYNRIQKYDSAHFYVDTGIKYSLANSSYYRHFYPELLLTSGINNYHRNKYNSSIDSLKKTLGLLNKNTDDIKVRMSYLYLAKSYKQLNNDKKAIYYLKKVDSVTNTSNYRLEIREAFELLKDYYSKMDNNDDLVGLLKRWISYEKVRQQNYSKLDQEIIRKYDFPKLIKEKERLLDEEINNYRFISLRVILFGCLALIIIVMFYMVLSKRKRGKLEEVLDERLDEIKKLEKKQTKSAIQSKLELSKELKQEILQELNKFERSFGYLKNNLTLVDVSKKLNTNSTYLSRVINLEKQKNFANYINDLRIKYCVNEIKTNKKFRQYSIKSIANEVGFNNIQSFAKAFSKNMGVNPAEYIKRINQGSSV